MPLFLTTIWQITYFCVPVSFTMVENLHSEELHISWYITETQSTWTSLQYTAKLDRFHINTTYNVSAMMVPKLFLLSASFSWGKMAPHTHLSCMTTGWNSRQYTITNNIHTVASYSWSKHISSESKCLLRSAVMICNIHSLRPKAQRQPRVPLVSEPLGSYSLLLRWFY